MVAKTFMFGELQRVGVISLSTIKNGRQGLGSTSVTSTQRLWQSILLAGATAGMLRTLLGMYGIKR